jgi:alpha-tubulin suppressor-like RCC1 family protein
MHLSYSWSRELAIALGILGALSSCASQRDTTPIQVTPSNATGSWSTPGAAVVQQTPPPFATPPGATPQSAAPVAPAPVQLSGMRGIGISLGYSHACAVTDPAGVVCWGDNLNGQLGDGTSLSQSRPVRATVSDAVMVSASRGIPMNAYTCAVLRSGTVNCWGKAVPGRAPGIVEGLGNAVAVTAGGRFACALRQGGKVACWGGDNYAGQLGMGKQGPGSRVPADVVGLAGAVAIAAGDSHACALLGNGQVMCWGTNTDHQLGDGTNTARPIPVLVRNVSGAMAITAGTNHSCAVLRNGQVVCWGSNRVGELGDGTQSNTVMPNPVGRLNDAVGVAAGANHTCALKRTGAVVCWGEAGDGQLGHGKRELAAFTPQPVVGLADAVALASGGDFSCALRRSGSAVCWGSNEQGRLGLGIGPEVSRPAIVPGIRDAAEVVTGHGFSCARHRSGSVSCWGWGETWHVDRAGAPRVRAFPPELIAGVSQVRRIFAGDRTVCAVDAAGRVSCWLGGLAHVPGTGKPGETGIPKAAPQISNPVAIEPATRRTLGLSTSGQLLGWISFKNDPARPLFPWTDVMQVEGMLDQACALHRGGNVDCWKDSSMLEPITPATLPVSGLSDAIAIAGDLQWTWVLRRSGEVARVSRDMVWKDGKAVAIKLDTGNHDSSYRNRCADCEDLPPATKLTAGRDFFCILQRDARVVCRGNNAAGQLGVGHLLENAKAEPVLDLTDVTDVAAASDHVCALRRDGTVACWGSNVAEQVTSGALGLVQQPMPVVGFVP